jgi:hypothetical protein|tara:strand:+ start:428 stop:1054 length:627 start_codon:yes stop_codon:yes gene_type:complete
MSPIISTLTSNWTPADVELVYLPKYVDRTGDGLDGTTFNGGSNSGSGWGYGGGNSDAVCINVSGSSAYKLISISNSKFQNSQNSQWFNIRVEQGTNFSTGTAVYTESKQMQFPTGNGAFEIPLAFPPLLQPNTTYVVGWGFPNNTSATGNSYSWSSLSNNVSFYDPQGNLRQLTLSDVGSYGGADPFDDGNGSDNNRGQHPIFGFAFA